MALTKNIHIDQGATYSTNVQYLDYYKRPIPLCGFTASSQLRTSYVAANAYANLNVTIFDAPNGNINVAMCAANSALLAGGRYYYDLVANNSNTNIVFRVVEGIATVNPWITHP